MAIKWTRSKGGGCYRGGGYEILSDDDGWIVKHADRGVIDEPFVTVAEAQAAAERDRAGASKDDAREHGELTRIILGTVVAAEDGINARQLAERLSKQGIPVTKHVMSTRLAELAKAGRIERISRGRYTGV